MTTHSLYTMILRPRRKRGGEGRRRGRGILDGPLYTQHALFGKRPAHMPAYGVGRRRKRRTTYGVGARRTVRRPVYVSRMGMGRKRRTVYGGDGRRKRRGGSLLGKLHNYVKSHRLVSKGLHHLSKHISHPIGHKIATVARNFAATQGYGRRRRRRRVMGFGPGIMTGMGRRRRKHRTTIKKPSMAQFASMGVAGMGRRHYKRRGDGRRRRRGGSIWSSINDFLKKHKVLSSIGKAITPLSGAFSPLVSGATQYAESQGYGRKHHMSAMHPRHHVIHHQTHYGVGLRHHSAHHLRRGGNNPYPTTNSFYGKPVF